MKRLCLSLILLLGIVFQLRADNILSVSSASGHPNDTVQIQLSLSNTDNVVAFQAEIPLGNSLSYIPNSCVLSSRSNGHSITASVVNGVLKILSYSLSLSPYSGNSGVLATFRLRLGNEPGNINLTLTNTRLSNSSGTALTHTNTNGVITLLSPKIRINNPQIDFGHYPIRSTYNNSINVTNIGNEPLVINSLSFSNSAFYSNTFSPTIIGAGNSFSIPISFYPTIAGNVSATATIYSNSISGNQNVILIANPYSVNELHVSNVEGYSDSIVIIDLSINNMDTIVGFQTKFILPQALEYVNGSFSISSRSNNHVCLSGVSGDTLTLLVYSPNNTLLRNNSGVIASFRLKLNGSSGYYSLQPINTVLSNRNGINVLSDAYSGSVSIRSPYIYSDNSINMGTSSVTENSIYSYSIYNYGNAPLVIDNIVFTQNGFTLQDTLPIIINQYHNRSLNIVYNGVNEGNFSALMKIYSNDPSQRLKDVNIIGNRYEPNEIAFSVDTVNYSQNPHVSVNMNNYSSITAVQFDFYYPNNYYNISSSDFQLNLNRCSSHSISTIALNDSVYRVLIFSMQNQNITGSNGTLLNITLHPKTTTRQGSYRVRASGVILSNSLGVNKFTGTNPSYSFNVITPTYTISTQANNNSFGNVIGGGVYNYLSTATITAVPNSNSKFLHWNDNDTNRIRNIIVTQDSNFTAYFKRVDTIYLSKEICQGGSYNFFGQTLTTTNTYSHTKNIGQYQDSVFILNFIVNQPKTTNLTAEICQGETYTLNGFNTNTAGLHTQNLQTYKGCDSTVNLTLTINQPATTNLTAEICQGETYSLNGFNANTAGLHTQNLQTYKGCDSTVNLTLNINELSTPTN
ncbi:MAG: choice-of-anchor D domain-containing protein, partial [Bacteroidales bacterium]|nr:choice-of-anchor D domain-containing protein [Bacteroidales bacterium]